MTNISINRNVNYLQARSSPSQVVSASMKAIDAEALNRLICDYLPPYECTLWARVCKINYRYFHKNFMHLEEITTLSPKTISFLTLLANKNAKEASPNQFSAARNSLLSSYLNRLRSVTDIDMSSLSNESIPANNNPVLHFISFGPFPQRIVLNSIFYGRFPHLRSLKLRQNKQEPPPVDYPITFVNTPNLTYLSAPFNCSIPHLLMLLKLKHLKCLDIRNSLLDEKVEIIARLSTLTYLHIPDTSITDVGISYLKALAHLSDLNISSCEEITDNAFPHLSQITTLRHLNITFLKKITTIAFAHLSSLRLQTLKMNVCDKVNAETFSEVGKITSLEELNAGNNARCLTNNALKSLANLVFLKTLNLMYCSSPQEPDLSLLSSHLTRLTELHISHMEINMLHIQAFKQLTHLTIGSCQGLLNPEGIAKCTSLISLDFEGSHRENGKKLFPYIAQLKHLTKLHLRECRGLTNKRVAPLGSLLTLTTLELFSCTGFTHGSFLSTLTNLYNLSIEFSEITDFSALKYLKNLESLAIASSPGLRNRDIKIISSLSQLTNLHIFLKGITTFSSLANLRNLTDLNLSNQVTTHSAQLKRDEALIRATLTKAKIDVHHQIISPSCCSIM